VNSTPAYSGATLLTGETNSILNPSTTTVGTFYYFCVATGLCGSDTSSVSGLQQIQGNLPGTASINSNLNTVCAGDTVFFNSTLTNFGSNPTLQWQVNGINISGANSNTFSIASLANNDSVSLTVISSTTVCPANTVYYSNSIPIVVNPLPSLTVNPNVNFCEGDTLFLTASGIGNIGWTGPNGFISSVTNPYILNGSALNTGTYLVSLELNGCIKKDSVNLQVINTPSIGITGVGNLTCIASSINLNAITNATNPTYLWTGVGIVSGANSNLINLNLPGTYFLTVKDQVTGCSNTDSVAIIQTSSLPDISVDTTQFLTCTQTFSSIGGFSSVPGIIYSWSPGGSNPNASSTIVNVPGNYTLTVTDPSNGCVNSDVVPVISTASNPNIFVGPNSAITCSQLNTFLIGGSLDTNVILLWSNNIGIPTSDTILISVPGVYTLTVSDTITGCISTASVTILDETAGCDEISFFNGLTPNNDGSNDVFQLRNIENYPENTFTLFNRYGMKVWDGKNYDNTKTAFRGLDNKGTELISGTYFFVLEYNNVELKGWIELIR
jgi:gliding motility-associated-like protein